MHLCRYARISDAARVAAERSNESRGPRKPARDRCHRRGAGSRTADRRRSGGAGAVARRGAGHRRGQQGRSLEGQVVAAALFRAALLDPRLCRDRPDQRRQELAARRLALRDLRAFACRRRALRRRRDHRSRRTFFGLGIHPRRKSSARSARKSRTRPASASTRSSMRATFAVFTPPSTSTRRATVQCWSARAACA